MRWGREKGVVGSRYKASSFYPLVGAVGAAFHVYHGNLLCPPSPHVQWADVLGPRPLHQDVGCCHRVLLQRESKIAQICFFAACGVTARLD